MAQIDVRENIMQDSTDFIIFGDTNSTTTRSAATHFYRYGTAWKIHDESDVVGGALETKQHARDMIKALEYLINNELLSGE